MSPCILWSAGMLWCITLLWSQWCWVLRSFEVGQPTKAFRKFKFTATHDRTAGQKALNTDMSSIEQAHPFVQHTIHLQICYLLDLSSLVSSKKWPSSTTEVQPSHLLARQDPMIMLSSLDTSLVMVRFHAKSEVKWVCLYVVASTSEIQNPL